MSYNGSVSQDNAGVKVPPPFIFLISILLGVGLTRLRPMSVVPETVAMPFGVASIVAAGALALLGRRRHDAGRIAAVS